MTGSARATRAGSQVRHSLLAVAVLVGASSARPGHRGGGCRSRCSITCRSSRSTPGVGDARVEHRCGRSACRGSCSAGLVGGMLSIAGASYQGVFRNPLVDPYLLGVAAGAGLGATIALTTGRGVTAGWADRPGADGGVRDGAAHRRRHLRGRHSSGSPAGTAAFGDHARPGRDRRRVVRDRGADVHPAAQQRGGARGVPVGARPAVGCDVVRRR